MPVHRERVDPVRDHDSQGLVHRRWLIPDDVGRLVTLPQAARLWRGLLDLGVIDGREEVRVDRAGPDGAVVESIDLPATASAGALLAGSGKASLVTQVVFTDEEGIRDPYALEGLADPEGFRDYTLYALDSGAQLFLPIVPAAQVCGACGLRSPYALPRFGEAGLLSLAGRCAGCDAVVDLGRDKGELKTGAVFLLEELACRAALAIELPGSPESEELPDAQVAQLLREAFGGTDELADDSVTPST